MSSNSDKIRISIDLPSSEYKAMHEVATYRMVSHRALVRAAISSEVERVQRKIRNNENAPSLSCEKDKQSK